MHKLKILAFLLMVAVLGNGCKQGEDSKPGVVVDPIFGTWTFVNPSSTATQIKGVSVVLEEGKIKVYSMLINKGAASAVVHFRGKVGTYEKSGETYTIHYSYETCDNIGTEQLILKIDPNNRDMLVLTIVSQSAFLTMKRATPTESVSMAGIEDKDCNVVSP